MRLCVKILKNESIEGNFTQRVYIKQFQLFPSNNNLILTIDFKIINPLF